MGGEEEKKHKRKTSGWVLKETNSGSSFKAANWSSQYKVPDGVDWPLG